MIVGGLERVYEIGRVFRNEGVDTRHNPEFTLMELYQAYTDYNGMMDLTERLYRHVAQAVLGTQKIVYNGVEMDLSKPFERITMLDLLRNIQALILTKYTLSKKRENLPTSTRLSMNSATERAIFSTCSLKSTLRNTLFSPLSLWTTRLRFHLLQRRNHLTRITLSVLSSL